MSRRNVLLAATSLCALSTVSYASAQTTEEAGGEVRRLERVTVTAEKREQSLQDVPESVTVYTDEIRQKLGLDNLADFARFTPSLSFSAGDDRVFLRGVGRQTNTNGSDPGVATYTDGIYDSSTASVSRDDFFVERVEVLRGPQGTLYGRNSIGGAINVISKRPTEEFSAEGRISAGNYDSHGVQASVAGSLAKGVRAKIAGSYEDQGKGYFKNVAGGPSEGGVAETAYFEAQLEADLTESFSVWLKADTTDSSGRPRAVNSAGSYDYFPFPTAYITPGSGFGFLTPGYTQDGSATENPGIADIRKFSMDSPSSSNLDDAYGFAGIAIWSLPSIDLKYLGGYRTSDYNMVRDNDGTSVTSYSYPLDPANIAAGEVFTGGPNCQWLIENIGPLCGPATIFPSQTFQFHEDKSFSSHEINAQSTTDSDVWWIVGAYYYEEDLFQESHFNNIAQPELLAPVGAAPNPNGDFVYAASDLATRSYALFGQSDWAVTDEITLTGGLRYSIDEKSGEEQLRVVGFGPVPGFTLGGSGSLAPALDFTSATISTSPAPGVVSAVTIDPVTGRASRLLKNEWSALSGTAGIKWQPDMNSNYFLRYARGYKSGGFNAGGISQFPQTGKEVLDSIEVGAKKTFADVLQVNATAFYYQYDGLQTPLTVEENGINITRFFNIEEAHAQGFEFESVWQPLDQLRLAFSYAFNDSEVDSACCFNDIADPFALQPGARPAGGPDANGNQPQDLKGERLPRTVPHKLGLNASYDIAMSNGSELTLSGNYSWQDKTYHGIFNRSYTQAPSFNIVDLVAVWTSSEGNYRLIGQVNNVFDEVGYDGSEGVLRRLPAGVVAQQFSLTPPRTFGVELQVRF